MTGPARAALLLMLTTAAAARAADDSAARQRGEYLLYAGGCISCHTVEDSDQLLAGGRPLETPFGTFYSPNITPDETTGIGTWSDADFIRAMRYGVSPEGYHYYPAFPYTSYAGMSDQDLRDLKAYLFSLPPIVRENQPHRLVWYAKARFPLRGWKWLNHQTTPFKPDPEQSEQWNRGAYLVRHLGHCGECHSPRGFSGAVDHSQALAGNPDGPEGGKVPAITAAALDDWSRGDIETYLQMGMTPDGDFVGGAMSEVIDDNTSRLSTEDRSAIATYLKSSK